MVYLIGSLRNPRIPVVRQALEYLLGEEVFASWYCAGEVADERWTEYEKGRGLSYADALKDYAAQHVFQFDKYHLDRADAAVLVYPAGRSGHMELGYTIGNRKPGYVLLDKEPERWDVMLAFANGVFFSIEDLLEGIDNDRHRARA